MCKVFMVTNMSKMEKINQAINTIAAAVTAHDDDGFGFVMQGKEGLFGERTLNTEVYKTQFRRPIPKAPFIAAPYYNRFGKKTNPEGAGLFHGRTSTNNVSLVNTHPINKHGWSLIHNGVVSNHGPDYEQVTTNDTEHILHYLANEGISAIEKYITGYYAVGAIDPHGLLHIFKDSTASLWCAELPELDAHVFATTYQLIEEVCEELKWKISVINKVNDNTYLVFDHGKLVSHTTFKPRGSTYYENQYSHRSLGYGVGNSYDDDYYGPHYTPRRDSSGSNTPIQSGEPPTVASNVTDIRTIGANVTEALAESKEVMSQMDNTLQKKEFEYLDKVKPEGVITELVTSKEVDGNVAANNEKYLNHVKSQLRTSEHDWLTYSEVLFLKECKTMADHTYYFADYYGDEIEYEEFILLDDNEMLSCTVVRADGTIVDPIDYDSETIFDGKFTRARA